MNRYFFRKIQKPPAIVGPICANLPKIFPFRGPDPIDAPSPPCYNEPVNAKGGTLL